MFNAAFTGIGFDVMNSALNSGELLVDLPGGGHVPRAHELEHLVDLRAHEVARHADDADGPEARVPERGPVVSRVDLEAGRRLRDQSRNGLEVAVESLTATMFGRSASVKRVVLDPDRGTSRYVVGDDRQVGGVGHALEVRDQPRCGGLL